MHHPWRWVRDHLPDWQVEFTALPDGVFGETDAPNKRIRVDHRLDQPQRRCTVDHEARHARDGDVGPQPAWREAQINRESAEHLIPFDRLLDAWVWSYSVEEMAEELWVDVATVRCRIENLNDHDRATIRSALAERDFHEEGQR